MVTNRPRSQKALKAKTRDEKKKSSLAAIYAIRSTHFNSEIDEEGGVNLLSHGRAG